LGKGVSEHRAGRYASAIGVLGQSRKSMDDETGAATIDLFLGWPT